MSEKINEIASGMFALHKIREAPWNSNVMPAEEYARLGEDMKRGGPSAIGRVLLAHARCVPEFSDASDDEYVAIDGNHRVRKARELGWTSIRGELDLSIDDEEKARTTGYLKNTERGSQDPYKLAEYFSWFSETKKMTHEEIAKLHGIDRTTVTKTLSLQNIAPDVKAKLADVPYITISHLEPIAAAPHHVQREVIKHVSKREHSTVAQIAQCVRTMTQEHEKRERLRKAAEGAKFPKCPRCGKAPNDFDYTWDGKKNRDRVRCANWHEWSLSEGLKVEIPARSASVGEKVPAPIPQSIKTELELREVGAAIKRRVKELVKEMDFNADFSFGWHGFDGRTKDGRPLALSANVSKHSADIEISRTSNAGWGSRGKGELTFHTHDCKIKDDPKVRSRVSAVGSLGSKRELAEFRRKFEEFMAKYGRRAR